VEGEGGDGKGRDWRGDETSPIHAPLIHISGYAPVNLEDGHWSIVV